MGVTCGSVLCLPDLPPTVVASSLVWNDNSNTARIFRMWSDGSIDYLLSDFGQGCPPTIGCTAIIIGPPSCAEDLDNNSDVGTTDLLQLLGKWGPCQ